MLLFVGDDCARKERVATEEQRDSTAKRAKYGAGGARWEEGEGEKDPQRQTENCQQTAFTIVTSKTRPALYPPRNFP